METRKRPRTTGMPNGRPKKEITKETLILLYDQYHNWDLVAKNLGVSSMTIYRRLKEFNLCKRYTWA